MHSEPLRGIFAKIERAKTHVVSFTERFNSYIASSPYEVASEVNADKTEEVWRYKLIKKFPEELHVIAGDAFHNLRSSLDNLACAVVIKSGDTPGKTYFPIAETVNKFEAALVSKAKNLPVVAQQMIRTLKPYKGGNDLLWLLWQAPDR